MNDIKKMKPTLLLQSVFGRQPGQTLTEFAAEVKALKVDCETRGDYKQFIEDCAKHHSVEVDWS